NAGSLPGRAPRRPIQGRAAAVHRGRCPTWATMYRERTGKWPTPASGPIPEALGETWSRVQSAFVFGTRGLAGGSSLARLLAERAGARPRRSPPPLTEVQIVTWMIAHHRRTGAWPHAKSGPVAGVDGETWLGVQMALVQGGRGRSRLIHAFR